MQTAYIAIRNIGKLRKYLDVPTTEKLVHIRLLYISAQPVQVRLEKSYLSKSKSMAWKFYLGKAGDTIAVAESLELSDTATKLPLDSETLVSL